MKHWPPYGIRLRTPRLELRLPTWAELDALADVALGGIHDPALMPFGVAWTDLEPDELARSVLQRDWQRIGEWRPDDWGLLLTVFQDGAPIGVQRLGGKDFAVGRAVSTFSWLGLAHQGKGLGTEMRAAVLHLAFEGLDALTATTSALSDNQASAEVSRKLGYRPNGVTHTVVRGLRVEEHRFALDRPTWEKHRTVDVTIEGLEPCLPLFGLESK